MKKVNYRKKKLLIHALSNLVLTMTIKNISKVRYQYKYTGKYRDAAHNICNLRY